MESDLSLLAVEPGQSCASFAVLTRGRSPGLAVQPPKRFIFLSKCRHAVGSGGPITPFCHHRLVVTIWAGSSASDRGTPSDIHLAPAFAAGRGANRIFGPVRRPGARRSGLKSGAVAFRIRSAACPRPRRCRGPHIAAARCRRSPRRGRARFEAKSAGGGAILRIVVDLVSKRGNRKNRRAKSLREDASGAFRIRDPSCASTSAGQQPPAEPTVGRRWQQFIWGKGPSPSGRTAVPFLYPEQRRASDPGFIDCPPPSSVCRGEDRIARGALSRVYFRVVLDA